MTDRELLIRARDALVEFGHHDKECRYEIFKHPTTACTCGWVHGEDLIEEMNAHIKGAE